MSDKSPKWGGPRTAGRGKKIGRPKKDQVKITLSASVSADVAEYLRSTDNTSQTIDAVVRATRAFKRWLAK